MKRSNIRRMVAGAIAACVCGFMVIGITGCDINESQMKTIANQSGLFAVLGWIAYDNPTPEVKQAVKGAVEVINGGVNLVEEGTTYTEVLYPLVDAYVIKHVPSHQAPLTRAGATAILSGIDLFFVSYPAAKEQTAVANEYVKQFTAGALRGLAMADNTPEMSVIKQQTAIRARLSL